MEKNQYIFFYVLVLSGYGETNVFSCWVEALIFFQDPPGYLTSKAAKRLL